MTEFTVGLDAYRRTDNGWQVQAHPTRGWVPVQASGRVVALLEHIEHTHRQLNEYEIALENIGHYWAHLPEGSAKNLILAALEDAWLEMYGDTDAAE